MKLWEVGITVTHAESIHGIFTLDAAWGAHADPPRCKMRYTKVLYYSTTILKYKMTYDESQTLVRHHKCQPILMDEDQPVSITKRPRTIDNHHYNSYDDDYY